VSDNCSGLEAKVRHAVRMAAINFDFRYGDFDSHAAHRVFDSQGRSFCTQNEFLAGLEKLGLRLEHGEKKLLLSRFDPRADGKVDFAAFVRFAGFSELEFDQLGARLAHRLKEVTAEGSDYRAAFMAFDLDGTSTISRREFREAVRVLGLPMTEAELHAVMKRFGQFDDADQVHYNDFLRFVVHRFERAVQRVEAESAALRDRERHRRLRSRAGIGSDKHEESASLHERRVVKGSGFNGSRRTAARGDALGFLRPVLGAGTECDQRDERDATVNAWLASGASQAERAAFHRVERALAGFELEGHAGKEAAAGQHHPQAFYDHASKTVNRVIDHTSGAKSSGASQALVLPEFAHAGRSDQWLSPRRSGHSGRASPTTLYAPADDWQAQWRVAASVAAGHSDALNAVFVDALYGKSGGRSSRSPRRRSHRSSACRRSRRSTRSRRRQRHRGRDGCGDGDAASGSDHGSADSGSSAADGRNSEASWKDSSSESAGEIRSQRKHRRQRRRRRRSSSSTDSASSTCSDASSGGSSSGRSQGRRSRSRRRDGRRSSSPRSSSLRAKRSAAQEGKSNREEASDSDESRRACRRSSASGRQNKK